MAARAPDSGAGGEVGQGEAQGSGEPQQILRACAESLLTAGARLEGERPVGNPAQPSVISGASSYTVGGSRSFSTIIKPSLAWLDDC